MAEKLTPDRRRALAEKAGVNEQSLYQSLSGKGAGFKPAECVRIERDTDFELRRWDLRPKDWHLIWPELIGVEGAPVIPGMDPAAAPASEQPSGHTDKQIESAKPTATGAPVAHERRTGDRRHPNGNPWPDLERRSGSDRRNMPRDGKPGA